MKRQQGVIVKLLDLKKLAAILALALVAIIGTGEAELAQGNRGNDQKQERKAGKQQEKADKARAKADQQRARMDRDRQTEWTRRNTRITNTRTTRVVGGTYYNVDPTVNVTSGRYRIYRNGSYYNTDNNGADMLRRAVNEGYRQGFAAARTDRSGGRNISWTNNNVYRTGTYGYSSGVDRSQYQYYFQQGFQRGYQDGSNSRFQDGYTGTTYEYGYNDGGTLNVIGTILNEVLNIQSY